MGFPQCLNMYPWSQEGHWIEGQQIGVQFRSVYPMAILQELVQGLGPV